MTVENLKNLGIFDEKIHIFFKNYVEIRNFREIRKFVV